MQKESRMQWKEKGPLKQMNTKKTLHTNDTMKGTTTKTESLAQQITHDCQSVCVFKDDVDPCSA